MRVRDRIKELRRVRASELYASERNWREHPEAQQAALRGVLDEIGYAGALLARETPEGDLVLIDGHLRKETTPDQKVPVLIVDLDEDEANKLLAVLDPMAAMAEANTEALGRLLHGLQTDSPGLQAMVGGLAAENGIDLFEDGVGGGEGDESETATLAERFGVPPCSVLDARQGYWQERKRAWLALGIESGLGRGGGWRGRAVNLQLGTPGTSGTSIFDPVLCELIYRWFCPPDGLVLDPFAGGSVRGIVASKLGRRYVGIELREEQVEANREQGERICGEPMPVWHCDDSRNLAGACGDVAADLVFTCPPYADLEVYSDDPRDISTMDYPAFVAVYREIICLACDKLKANRFACIVVGDVRDKAGNYRNFVSDTKQAFTDTGLALYNDAVLVTALGSLPICVGKPFTAGRKLGKTHQNVLVFIKGDAKVATKTLGDVDAEVALQRMADMGLQPEGKGKPWGDRGGKG